MAEARITEVKINCSAGGAVAIEKYANVKSDYGISQSLSFAIPEDWTTEQAKEFQEAEYAKLREIVDTLADAEYIERWTQSYLNPDRD